MIKKVADLAGRLIIGLFFFFEAVDSIVYFKDMKQTLSAYGVDWAQEFLIVSSIILLVLGSVMVIIGYYASVGAAMLFVYWFVFTLTVYPFWMEDVGDKTLSIKYFSRNMALCGGLLILIANGATGWSVKRILHTLRLPK
jgi:putative oxidoreductase